MTRKQFPDLLERKNKRGAKIKPKPENLSPEKTTEKQPGKKPHSQQAG
jgi:hypothetical protein